MFCKNCGTNLQSGTKFCIKCGTAVGPVTGSGIGGAQNVAQPQGSSAGPSIGGTQNATQPQGVAAQAQSGAAGKGLAQGAAKAGSLAAKTGLSVGALAGIGIACGVVLILSVVSIAGFVKMQNKNVPKVQNPASEIVEGEPPVEEVDDYQERYDAKYQESLDRRRYYLGKIEEMRTNGTFPIYGNVDNSLKKPENYFIIMDIDHDEREELIICLLASPASADWDYRIYDVNDIAADDIYVEYMDDSTSVFFLDTNWIKNEPNLHGEDSVINYYQYNANTDTYEWCQNSPNESELGTSYVNVYKYSFQDDLEEALEDGLADFVTKVVPR